MSGLSILSKAVTCVRDFCSDLPTVQIPDSPSGPALLDRAIDTGVQWPKSSTRQETWSKINCTGRDGTGAVYVEVGAIRVRHSRSAGKDNFLCIAGPWAGSPYPQIECGQLLARGRIRACLVYHSRYSDCTSVRIAVQPEDGPETSSPEWTDLDRRTLRYVLEYVDMSTTAWSGDWDMSSSFCPCSGDLKQESLFYLFNTLPSPRPSVSNVIDRFARRAMEDILEYSIAGLKTPLYPYQKRSAAMMVQKETTPRELRDPRQVCLQGPTGQHFYYDNHVGRLILEPAMFQEPKGGILAETMGYGKTLICLSVILATRGHYSKIPRDRDSSPIPPTSEVPSLFDMVATNIIRNTIPWKAEFCSSVRKGSLDDECVQVLRSRAMTYIEPSNVSRRKTSRVQKGRGEHRVRLSYSTLVIVPPNLFGQWLAEFNKHIEKGALDVLALGSSGKNLPDSRQLALYDIVLMTSNQFYQEFPKAIAKDAGEQTILEEDRSPLTGLRWLRIIVDEGTGFMNGNMHGTAVALLDRMHVDRRWIVSGTPSDSLRGAEISLSTTDGGPGLEDDGQNAPSSPSERRQSETSDREEHDLAKLKILTLKFLKIEPWTSMMKHRKKSWRQYFLPFDNGGQPRVQADLQALLQSIMIRHTLSDVEVDLRLPPFYHKVTYLKPSFYDCLSINIFVMFIVSNSVTSERTDADYLFHRANRKALEELVTNLRHASFHWSGNDVALVKECIENCRRHLEKKGATISDLDRALLLAAIATGERAINDAGWLAFGRLHDIGVFVEEFPKFAAEACALNRASSALLLGVGTAKAVPSYVAEHVCDEDPTEGLAGAGLRAMQAARRKAALEVVKPARRQHATTLLHARGVIENTRPPSRKRKRESHPPSSHHIDQQPASAGVNPGKGGPHAHSRPQLPAGSILQKTNIVGFSSSKLRYLIDQVLEHYGQSKIIIFYELANVAYWIAEVLELLSLEFRIYAPSLSLAKKSAYLAQFNRDDDDDDDTTDIANTAANTDTNFISHQPSNQDQSRKPVRILLMPVKSASHGLHVAAANRIYIISPIWQPHIEAQAIKRAHRIGQTGAVHVETLVLRGTLEDQIMTRKQEMIRTGESRAAEKQKSLLDDGSMRSTIESIKFVPFPDQHQRDVVGKFSEGGGEVDYDDGDGMVARLSQPRKLFAF